MTSNDLTDDLCETRNAANVAPELQFRPNHAECEPIERRDRSSGLSARRKEENCRNGVEVSNADNAPNGVR